MVTKIRKIRRAKDLTQVQLAELSGVGRATIARYESGETTAPSIDCMRKIAKVLGTTIDDLVCETEEGA